MKLCITGTRGRDRYSPWILLKVCGTGAQRDPLKKTLFESHKEFPRSEHPGTAAEASCVWASDLSGALNLRKLPIFTMMVGDLNRKFICEDTTGENGTLAGVMLPASGNCWKNNVNTAYFRTTHSFDHQPAGPKSQSKLHYLGVGVTKFAQVVKTKLALFRFRVDGLTRTIRDSISVLPRCRKA